MIIKKQTSVILVLSMFILLQTPNKIFAQGTNAPEAMSFEPVDATDMVNLVTGDFTYVLPLMNVPSPEGGYPISLFYHAGIAMEQEASWVGLGWNINPGAITRNINGNPDDWGKTDVQQFFYDKGWENDYYSISLDVEIEEVVSVGVSASWGTNKSLGGSVSIGIGKGMNKLGFTLGSDGASLNASFANISANLGTDGVSIGYGFSKIGNNSASRLGLKLNYSYNGELSGGISYGKVSSTKKGIKKGSIGMSFSSKGMSMNAKMNGFGAGISASNYSVSGSDYDIMVSTSGFSIPIYIFKIGYKHANVKYALTKKNILSTSGFLYPVEANNIRTAALLEKNTYMDANILQKFTYTDLPDDLIDYDNTIHKSNLVLPNYDNYNVTAQGLSGTISPYTYSEFNLFGEGNKDELDYIGNDYEDYVNNVNSTNQDAIKKIGFTFKSAYSSFSRHETSNIFNTSSGTINSEVFLNSFGTHDITTNYNPLSFKNFDSSTMTYKKKEGNVIEVFTNLEIRNGIVGFIEAEGIDRTDSDTFLDKGIGAYKITTSDGKTYHYSLPVYQFESIKKSFKEEWHINDNFVEFLRYKPYATHWLLTAITGPDYVDIGNNGLDENDYGYWVSFDYGKWSDGYVWQTPNGRYEEIKDKDYPEDSDKSTYTYSWGRKQIYYLDAIKTRTHTALFIKDLRDDTTSESKNIYDTPWDGTGELDVSNFKKFTNEARTNTFIEGLGIVGHELSIGRYYKVPKEKSLKLVKIILLKNSDLSYDKSRGHIISNEKGYCSHHTFFMHAGNASGYINDVLNLTPITHTEFDLHLHQNILDVSDIIGTNLESKALQLIDFKHNYSLAKNTPNSEAPGKGRLTLSAVNFKGKEGTQITPPYQFSYILRDYDENEIDDWGYNKLGAGVWSLNKIKTPIGQEMSMQYESDSYYTEAASTYAFTDINVEIIKDPGIFAEFTGLIITSNGNEDLLDYVYIGEEVVFEFDYNADPIQTSYTNYSINRVEKITMVVSDIGTNNVTLSTLKRRWLVMPDYVNPMSLSVGDGDTFPLSGAVGDYNISYNGPKLITAFKGDVGGGIRTKAITISDGIKSIARTQYNYINPNTGKTSGITSFTPSKIPKGIPYISELPPPMVMYGNVEMVNTDGDGVVLGSTSYEFETLEKTKEEYGYIFSLGNAFKVKEQQRETTSTSSYNLSKFIIYNNLGILGRLNKTKSYNNKGQILSATNNRYKTNLNSNGEIGVTQESHKSLKRVTMDGTSKYYFSATSKVNYPNVLESSTTTNGGFSTTSYSDKFDFLTGQLLESTSFDSNGNKYKTKKIPAYTIMAYADMGSKIDNPTNKNMLSQQAAKYIYLFNSNTNYWDVIGASIQTWNNEWAYSDYTGNLESSATGTDKIWRKYKSYIWQGEIDSKGIYIGFDNSNDDNFVWGVGVSQTNAKWSNISTITKYDHYSMPLEMRDINGNHAATKMGNNHANVFASANAKYSNMYYSGAEDVVDEHPTWFSGEIKMDDNGTSIDNIYAHTGKYAVHANAGNAPFIIEHVENEGRYKISVWVYNDGSNNYENTLVQRQGNSDVSYNPEEVVFAGDWVQLNYTFNLNNGQKVWIKNSSDAGYYDDFRLLPIASTMISYVYNEWNELSYILGANNMASKYEYNDAGKLWRVYTEVANDTGVTGGFKLTNEYHLHYNNLLGGVLANASFSYTLSANTVSTSYGSYIEENLDVDLDLTNISLAPGAYTLKWYYQIQGGGYVLLNPNSSADQLHKHLSWSGQGQYYNNCNMKIVCEIYYGTSGVALIETPYLQIQCTVNGGNSSGSITGSN